MVLMVTTVDLQREMGPDGRSEMTKVIMLGHQVAQVIETHLWGVRRIDYGNVLQDDVDCGS